MGTINEVKSLYSDYIFAEFVAMNYKWIQLMKIQFLIV
jgi:hypothetical protein